MVLPMIWSVPEALLTAELATTFPENSGYVAWVTAAFGPFWGFQVRRGALANNAACCNANAKPFVQALVCVH